LEALMSCFCISVLFHDARFHGRRDGGTPEWPPSPLRLFQALVAAFAARGGSNWLETARPALTWLQQLSPPLIVAPVVHLPPAYVIAIPNNDMNVPAAYWAKGVEAPRDKQPSSLKSMKTVQPTCMEAEPAIHYLYCLPQPAATNARSHIEQIESVVGSVTHLGWGVDMVAAKAVVMSADQAQSLAGRRWKVTEDFGTPLRVPMAQTLDALVARQRSLLASVADDGVTLVPPLRKFTTVTYADSERVNHRPLAAFHLLPADPDDRRPRTSLRQERIVCVAAMLRHAACAAALDDLDEEGWRTRAWADQFVAGHGPHTAAESFLRFSYLPIPTLDYGKGMVYRALIAETPGGDGRSARWVAQRLGGAALRDEQSGREVAVLRRVQPEGDAVFRQFLGESDRWQTITPIILPGFDDNDRGKASKLLARCFEQACVPREMIADWEMQKSPWSRASAPTGSYLRTNRLEHLPAWHVRIYFNHRVWGPLAMGAGRHRGLGLMAAWD
jgi:CRISPR-associated protein Csb2